MNLLVYALTVLLEHTSPRQGQGLLALPAPHKQQPQM